MKCNLNEYKKVVNENQLSKNDLLFSSLSFNELNQDKCEFIYVHYNKKMAMIFGMRDSQLIAPFSAPFAYPRYASDHIKYSHVLSFYSELISKFKDKKEVKEIKISLPPSFYNNSLISKLSLGLQCLNFKSLYRDINSHIDLKKFDIDLLPSSTKNSIKVSNKNMNKLIVADSIDDKKRAYRIIKQNREMKGYPLRMTWEQVSETTKEVVKADFFISTINGEDSSAAIVFHINHEVMQVIYWGANELGEQNNAMYYLPFELIKYYKNKSYKYLDVGPSSECGIVNHGLNDYKQMIGCENSIKETWIYNND
jgi:hypothetical protein